MKNDAHKIPYVSFYIKLAKISALSGKKISASILLIQLLQGKSGGAPAPERNRTRDGPGTLEGNIEKCWYSVLVRTGPLKALAKILQRIFQFNYLFAFWAHMTPVTSSEEKLFFIEGYSVQFELQMCSAKLIIHTIHSLSLYMHVTTEGMVKVFRQNTSFLR